MAELLNESDQSKLLENALDAVVGCDEAERVIYWNRHAEVIFGWTRLEATGRLMGDLIVPERLRPAHRAGMRRFKETGIARIQNQRIEVPAIRKDGSEFPAELTVTSMRDAEGHFRFYSFLRDISPTVAARRAEEQMRALQQRFARSAGAIDLGVWYCDLPLDKMVWSPEVRGHFFVGPDVPIDRELFMLRLHPEDRARTQAAIERTLEDGAPYDIVYRTVDPENPARVRHIRSVGWLDRDETGQARRFDGVTRDVSGEHARQVELELARDAAERANRQKSSFLANMSHEIRTPLGAMLGFAQLLRADDVGPERRAAYLDVLIKNGDALGAIINDVLDLSKVEAGRLGVVTEDFDVVGLVEDVVALFGLEAQKRNLRLTFTAPPTAPTLHSDRARLRQILINLINNALKFTLTGGIALDVSPPSESGRIAIDVTDTGLGIPAREAERIFEAFEQADNTITRTFGGTGLGLALSRSIARQLGGDVELVRSEVGRGSTFRLIIHDQAEAGGPVRADAPETGAKPFDLTGTRVLVADDSADNRYLLTELLEREGVIVTCANDGREACARVAAMNFDLVLMDVQMPRLDGYAAAREIQTYPRPPPIVAVTAHAFEEDRRQSRRAGCVDHLIKPIQLAELRRVVHAQRRVRDPAP